MEFHQLRALRAVSDCGSFAAAADALGLTQPALSMQLSRLEEEAGFPLFLKVGRRKVLTSEGTVVLGRARRILAEIRDLEAELAAYRGLEAGTLAVAAGDTVLRRLLSAPLAAFGARWPGVRLHVWNRTSGETLGMVRDGRADLGILTLPAPAPDLEVRPWREFRWVAAAPAGSWGPGEDGPVTVEELAGRNLVLLEPGTRLHDLWSAACASRGLVPRSPVETGSTDIQLEFASRGLGTALVPDYAVVPSPALEIRPVPGLGTGTLALVLRPGRRTRAAEAFLESAFPRPGAPG